VPYGVAGELWIGGEGVARGYLNRKKLTSERFVENPFRDGERIYRTGDLARRLIDGRLECLGRIDSQVKIRGYRVELREIEIALSSHENVRDCVAVARKEDGGETQLVAYLVQNGLYTPSVEDLRTYLQAILPEYMIPSAFVFIKAIPLTLNGKVDRAALPTLEVGRTNSNVKYVAPRNQVERILSEIWSDILGVKQVGVFDHFFELGGHSLSATRLIARIQSRFEIELPLRIVFLEPTIAGMSKHIVYSDFVQRYHFISEVRRWNRLVPAQPMGSRLPFFLVAGLLDADDLLRILSNLIPHLGLDQPVYGFQPRWFDGHSKRYSSAEEAASEFLAELRALQPKGPYLLGGDCTGGIVALAMAQELSRQGEEVRLLVLFDTERPTVLSSFKLNLNLAKRRGEHIAQVIGQTIRGSLRSKFELWRNLGSRKLRSILGSRSAEESGADRLLRMSIDYLRTMYRYRVRKYHGRIALIVSEDPYISDKRMGWDGVATRGLEVHRTPGDHLTRYELHSKELAQRLLDCLERAQGKGAGGEPGPDQGFTVKKAEYCFARQ
jgi:thioesterase domain-containing protein